MLNLASNNILVSTSASCRGSVQAPYYSLMHHTIQSMRSNHDIIVFDTSKNNIGKEYGVYDAKDTIQLEHILESKIDGKKKVLVVCMCKQESRASDLINFMINQAGLYKNVTYITAINTNIKLLSHLTEILPTVQVYSLNTLNSDGDVVAEDLLSGDKFSYNTKTYIGGWFKLTEANRRVK